MPLKANIIFVAVLYQSTVASSQDDCLGIKCNRTEQYCAAGKSCLDHMSCLEDKDCLNYSNWWMQPMCIGPVTCKMPGIKGEPGKCSKICDTMCISDKDCGKQQYCTTAGVCLDHATCRKDEDCLETSNGWPEPECTGSIICEDGSCEKNCELFCKNDKECGEEQYCAGGTCLNHARCRHENDCLSESNMWYEPMCEGSITCNDGSCGKTCDVFCEHDKDCGEQQYCGANVCQDQKICKMDVDCLNPSNRWGRAKCVGFDKCNDGVCRRTCGYQCADKSDRVECDAPPCEENRYDEGFTCVNDYCGGCNTIVFDTAGNKVFPTLPPVTSDHHKPFKFSEECMDRCPKVIEDWQTSKCDSKKLGGCACPYERDKFCALECHSPSTNWSLKCMRTRPRLDDDSINKATSNSDSGDAPFTHHTPFETSPECVQKCSEADVKFNEECDYTTMNTCHCVLEDDPYCFYTCMHNGVYGLWAMACQNVLPPPPPEDSRDTSDPTLETEAPAPTPAIKVGKRQKIRNKQINKVPRSRSGKARKEAKQTK